MDAANDILMKVLDSSSSSESSSSEDEDFIIAELCNEQIGLRGGLRGKPRINLYVENVVAEYTIQEFKSHFRMTPNTFEAVLRLIGPEISSTTIPSGSKPIDAKKQLLIALWVFGTPDCHRSVCEKFNVGKATLVRTVRRVSHALHSIAKNVITWPNAEEATIIMTAFERQRGFPNIIGAIDGTHIKIKAPKDDHISYVNRKGYHSIQLQAVCDNKMRFISTFAGSVGSVHDARVFRNSPLYGNLSNPEQYFPNNSHIIGDSAYPLSSYVMVPYKNNGHLSRRQQNYNFCHSSTRMIIEKAFGLLKARFRRILNCLEMTDISKIPQFIIVCCVLHNICIDMDDLVDVEQIECDQHEDDHEVNDNNQNELRRQGVLKRNFITDSLEIVINE